MTIIITSDKLIKDIREEFTRAYPFLRIEFFLKSSPGSRQTVTKIADRLAIGNIFKTGESAKLQVHSHSRVKDLVNDIENKFGIYAQLYRRSGSLWHEITFTDEWTIQHQDEAGNEICKIISKGIATKAVRHIRSIKKAV